MSTNMLKKAKAEINLNCFPKELIIEILSWLPVKFVMRLKCVSKSWCHIIKDPYFINLHLCRSNGSLVMINELPPRPEHIKVQRKMYCFTVSSQDVAKLRYPKEIPPYSMIVGSCNGLLCLAYVTHTYYDVMDHCLYNPATRVCKALPRFYFTCLQTNFQERIVAMSLAYDQVLDDYKILKIVQLWNLSLTSKLDHKSLLYSLKSDAWEIIENPPWNINVLEKTSTIFANNSFHWLCPDCKDIKCFDISTRRYHEILIPERVFRNSPKLAVLQGQLCLVTCYLDIWILKEQNCWTQIFRNLYGALNSFDVQRNWTSSYLSIYCLKDGSNDIVLACSNGRQLQKYLICCNLKSEAVNKIDISGFVPDDVLFPALQPWVESLVDPLA